MFVVVIIKILTDDVTLEVRMYFRYLCFITIFKTQNTKPRPPRGIIKFTFSLCILYQRKCVLTNKIKSVEIDRFFILQSLKRLAYLIAVSFYCSEND